jgi:hypothetical protein
MTSNFDDYIALWRLTGVTMEAWDSAGGSLTRLTELPNLGKLGS